MFSCMFFFTVEYLARFTVVPHKWHFVRQPLNIIDLLTVVPFLAEACLPLLGIYDVELRNFRGLYFDYYFLFSKILE